MLLYTFFLILLSRGLIPSQYKALVDAAIHNFSVQLPLGEINETLYPGNYKFTNIEFKLLKITTAPNTNDIKNFAIDENYIALYKNNQYNLKNDFFFIDPLEQKIYKIMKLIAHDDLINIYTKKDASIFDILTNFRLNRKTVSNQLFTIGFNQDEENLEINSIIDNPTKFDINFSTFGSSTIDTIIEFKSKYDIKISSIVSFILNLYNEINIQYNFDFNKTGTLPSIPVKTLSYAQTNLNNASYFSLLGFKIDLNNFLNLEFSAKNCMVYIPIGMNSIFGKKISGSKYIEITPYNMLESNWTFSLSDIFFNSTTTTNFLTYNSQYKFKIEFDFNIYFTNELIFGSSNLLNDNKSKLVNGLNFTFCYDFKYDKVKCLAHFLYGYEKKFANDFYSFNGLTILNENIINSTENYKNITDNIILDIYNIGFCLGDLNKIKVKELHESLYDNKKYVITFENVSLSWVSKPSFVSGSVSDSDTQLFMRIVNTTSQQYLMEDKLPYTNYPVGSNYAYIKQFFSPSFIKRNINELRAEFYYKYLCNYMYNGCQSPSSFFAITSSSSKMTGSINNKNFPVLNLLSNTFMTRELELFKLFNYFSEPRIIANFPADNRNYTIMQFQNDYTIGFDTSANFSNNLLYSLKLINHEKYYSKKNYIRIIINFVNVITVYNYFDLSIEYNGYVLGHLSRKLLPKGCLYPSHKDLNCTDFETKFYGREHSNPISIKIGFYDVFSKSNKPQTTKINYDQFPQYFGKCNSFKSNTNNSVTLCFHYENQIPVNVKLNKSVNTLYEMISSIHSFLIDDYFGTIIVDYSKGEQYYIIEMIIAENISLENNDIFFSACDVQDITFLYDNVTMINNKIYCVHVHKKIKTLKIPIRRMTNSSTYGHYHYLIGKFNNPDNYTFNKEGEKITFVSKTDAYSFVMTGMFRALQDDTQYIFNKFIYSKTQYKVTFYALVINSDTVIITITHSNPNFPNSLYLAFPMVFMNNGQLKTTFNSSFIKNIFQTNEMNYLVYVVSSNQKASYIRYNDQLSPINNNFYLEPLRIATFKFNETGIFDFYEVCNTQYGIMCEIKYNSIPNENEYHLVRFETRNGINITGQGMLTGFIHVPKDKNVSFYKSFLNPITFIKSYNNSNTFELEAEDFIKEDSLLEEFVSGYRKFCLKLNDGNKIPLSVRFLSENMSTLKKYLGVNDMFDFTQYSITDDDCLAINLSAIGTNKISSIPVEACDLPINNTEIPINLDKIKFIPRITPSMEYSPSREFSYSSYFSKEIFTKTNDFSPSEIFTKSSSFTSSFTFLPTPTQTIYGNKISFSMSLVYSPFRSVTFSASLMHQSTNTMCGVDENNQFSYCMTISETYKYLPYIIYSLKPSYTYVLVIINKKPVKRITPQQLIGIVCGSCAAFFAIIGITILIVRKKLSSYVGLVENISETTSLIDADKKAKENNVDIKKIDDNNIDDAWL